MDEELRRYLDGMREQINDQFDRLIARMSGVEERLSEAMDAIREDLTVLGGANDRVRLSAGQVRAEITALARNIADMQQALLEHGTRLDRLERCR